MSNEPQWIYTSPVERWAAGAWLVEHHIETHVYTIYLAGKLVQQVADLDTAKRWIAEQERAVRAEEERQEVERQRSLEADDDDLDLAGDPPPDRD